MSTDRVQGPLAWDVPLRRYCKAQEDTSREILNFAGERYKQQTRPETSARENEICDRLYYDHFHRKQKRIEQQLEKEKAEEQRQRARMRRRFTCDLAKMAEKQRVHHMRMREEHSSLSQLLTTLRELEAERTALHNICPLRLYPPMEFRDAVQDALFHKLMELGDHKRNAVAINSLLVPNSPEIVTQFIAEAMSIRDQQRIILEEFEESNTYDKHIDQILCIHVIEMFERQIDQIENETPLELPENCTPEEQIEKYVERAAQQLMESGFLEDLKHERRELLVEMNILRLSMLHQLVRLDIDWRGLLAKLRLSKFHVRGYDSNEVENVKESDWFRDLGSSTSLRNSMKIRNAANTIFASAVDILVNNKERPSVPEELLNRHQSQKQRGEAEDAGDMDPLLLPLDEKTRSVVEV